MWPCARTNRRTHNEANQINRVLVPLAASAVVRLRRYWLRRSRLLAWRLIRLRRLTIDHDG